MEKKDEEVRQEKMELQMIEKRLQSLIESNQYIKSATRIVLMKRFLSDLEYVKGGN